MIAIDTGGTFTDFVRWSSAGVRIHKERSTPDDPARSILAGLAVIDPEGREPVIVYGTTLATNALLERKGARTVLLTTAGFEDVLEIGRQARPALYALHPRKPEPLIPRARRLGVRERIRTDGTVSLPLTAAEVHRALRSARRAGAVSVAVCFLNSFASPRHERALTRVARTAGFEVSASHEVSNEFREYERFTVTAINALTSPLLKGFLRRLSAALRRLPGGRARKLWVMQSDGGMLGPDLAGRFPVRTILSGPAGGVTGAVRAGGRPAKSRVITLDIGGTSTDVCLCAGTVPLMAEGRFGDFPVRLPMVDVHSVGAGGGSIARIDELGRLRVGPESAGADPGPICYGKGAKPTVTDANLLLGRLDPRGLLGGSCPLERERVIRSMRRLGVRLRLSAEAVAEGIVRVANARMEAAIRAVSVERGYDPRDFSLLAFGGGGGLHACALADALGIPTVRVPAHPGVFSAFGMLFAPVSRTYAATVLRPLARRPLEDLESAFRAMESEAGRELAGRGVSDRTSPGRDRARVRTERSVDLRYRGQSYELNLPLSARLEEAFHAAHARAYGYADRQRGIEVVTVRLRAWVAERRGAPPTHGAVDRGGAASGRLFERGRWRPCVMVAREGLGFGQAMPGPALVLEYSATTYVPTGWSVRRERAGDLRMERRT